MTEPNRLAQVYRLAFAAAILGAGAGHAADRDLRIPGEEPNDGHSADGRKQTEGSGKMETEPASDGRKARHALVDLRLSQNTDLKLESGERDSGHGISANRV
ncbi:MAG: hypothetical protein MUC42_17540 [Bryobacter sp.]|nr:hypothetical protein [Bryobacter sp.]